MTRPVRHSVAAPSVQEIVSFLESLCPSLDSSAPPLSATSNLQVGAPTDLVEQIYVIPQPSYSLLTALPSHKSALLISAAPLFDTPPIAFDWKRPAHRLLLQLFEKQIAFYVLPPSYAAAPEGYDACLAEAIGFHEVLPLYIAGTAQQFKLVVFVPPPSVPDVHRAAAEAGAGTIGEYTYCSFQAPGKGTFLPSERANPAIGKRGQLEEVEEVRLEMVVPKHALLAVIEAVKEAHPYEEVAYDVYPLHNVGAPCGRGCKVRLEKPMVFDDLLSTLEQALDLGTAYRLRYTPPDPQLANAGVTHLAVGVGIGSCNDLLGAAQEQKIEVIIVGGTSPSDWIGVPPPVLVDIGFLPAVAPGLKRLTDKLRQVFGGRGVKIDYAF
ncbi:MAG TPA: Nif3-like dinuclear metal center hexameric protein [Chthonomonas sp.]|uniref:Nif3-like dinuclear metal center hexameric protein n=1 Tax=Chthonomonas sp. TaxID=2282153 RepID=UPI002B4ABADC|nr:Nif3-like dinuclear metal center hexameric protein [Chthonomonas sp.]HLI48045.1 Nif3-like dinuclear metal center hexameric protein [Chthonomonas sp.]